MKKSVEGLLNKALLYQSHGAKAKVRKCLKSALRVLSERRQTLPTWVEVGVSVQWIGEGSHEVYRVVSVNRKKIGWYFVGTRTCQDGVQRRIYFHQETGRIHWRLAPKRLAPKRLVPDYDLQDL